MEGSEYNTLEPYHGQDGDKCLSMTDTETQLGWYNQIEVDIKKKIISFLSTQTFPCNPVANEH